MGIKIELIGSFSDKPKSDPLGPTRIAPIRAYGESEIRQMPIVVLILAAKLKRLQRHGSHITKVAIKRLLRTEKRRNLEAEKAAAKRRGFPTYRLTSIEIDGPAPTGLQKRQLLEELAVLRGLERYTPTPSTFGMGHGFYLALNFADLLGGNIGDEASEHRKAVRDILNSPDYETQYRRTMGDEAWERRQGILNNLNKVVKEEGEKKDD